VLKIAIIGCGKIADSHAQQIMRIENCELVAACDREELMAIQLQDRFHIGRWFNNVEQMIHEARPNVVHITTPPQSHFRLAMQCLERGCHVYLEKPFAINYEEARKIIQFAEKRRLKITAGHDDQFRHAARRMRTMIQDGFIGENSIHMESYYGYELGGSGYANALLADKRHWVRGLPGGLMHNIISHGIARIAEYLTDDDPRVVVIGFASSFLKRMGEEGILDELRAIIHDESGATAYFTFSSQMRPSLHQFRIFGSKNGLLLDQDNETLIKLRGVRHKSYLEQFIPPLAFASQYWKSMTRNLRLFLRNDFHPKAGMKFLIESFYYSILADAPPPIPYREILLTARIMDRIFEQIYPESRFVNVEESGSA
jgi:predicted dehydrogenase